MSKDLKPTEIRFIEEYIEHGNQTRAYLNAGFKTKNYKSASVQASALLAKPRIQKQISKRREALLSRLEVSKLRVLRELAKIAFSDISSIVDVSSGTIRIKDFDQCEKADLAAIASVTESVTRSGGTVTVKMHDKQRALELLLAEFKDSDEDVSSLMKYVPKDSVDWKIKDKDDDQSNT